MLINSVIGTYIIQYCWRKGPLPPLDHLENYQEIPEKWLNVGSPLRSKNLKIFIFRGLRGIAPPPDPLTRGCAPGAWTPMEAPPQAPVIGSRSRARHPDPLCLIPESAPD